MPLRARTRHTSCTRPCNWPLSPRSSLYRRGKRAVLLLRDVLGWPARDTARLLESSVASADSALQRARATLQIQFPGGRPAITPQPDSQQRALVERYASTWEHHDLDSFVALLMDHAVPP
jgi:RNA polymerase sigma-70 factor, ECF subfamily